MTRILQQQRHFKLLLRVNKGIENKPASNIAGLFHFINHTTIDLLVGTFQKQICSPLIIAVTKFPKAVPALFPVFVFYRKIGKMR